jgi:hypothetical protein
MDQVSGSIEIGVAREQIAFDQIGMSAVTEDCQRSDHCKDSGAAKQAPVRSRARSATAEWVPEDAGWNRAQDAHRSFLPLPSGLYLKR